MAEAKKRQVKEKADAIASANKTAAQKKAAAGTPVSGKSGNKVKVYLRNTFGIDFPLDGGKVVSIQCSTFNLRGLDTGVIDLSRVQENIVDAADWDAVLAKYGHQRIFKSGALQWHPVDISVSEEKAVIKDMQENSAALPLAPVDPERTASKPAKKEGA